MKPAHPIGKWILLLSLTLPVAAHAQTSAEDYCNHGRNKFLRGDFDGAIADDTSAIELDPKYADAFADRGHAKQAKGDNVGAIADYSRLIELEPKSAFACTWRGDARLAKDDLDGAMADYNHAIELDPKNQYAFNNRGTAQYLRRNWTDAMADFCQVCELIAKQPNLTHPSNARHVAYTKDFIWLLRARLGEQEAANAELTDYLNKQPKGAPEDWPVIVAHFLLEQTRENDLFAAAKTPDVQKEQRQRCEAWYYAGMKRLLTGDKITATDYFRKCLATEMKNSTPYHFARTELKALGQ